MIVHLILQSIIINTSVKACRFCFVFMFVLHALLAKAESIDIEGIRYKLDVVNKIAEVSKGLRTEWEYVNILETIDYNNEVYQVSSIGKDAFAQCSYMMGITIPNSIISIGENAFAHCSSLTDISIPSGLSTISDKTFYGCTNLIKIVIPPSVSVIGKFAFSDCYQLQSLTIPNGVTAIGEGAFRNCSGVRSVTIPEKLSAIEKQTFFGCSNLINITIPASVEIIGQEAYADCSSLEQITVKSPTPPVICSDTFPYYSISVFVPKGCGLAYLSADNWNKFTTINDNSMFLELSDTGMMTLCATEDLDFLGVSGLEAYIASGFNKQTGKLLVTRVYDVPADTGLLLKGIPGTYSIPYTTSYSVYANLLEGVTTTTTIAQTSDNYTNYILADGTHGLGFYIVSGSGEIAAGKAYLKIPSSLAARRVNIGIDYSDQISSIDSIVSEYDHCELYFDLQGHRIYKKPMKAGFYINNAKKIMIK